MTPLANICIDAEAQKLRIKILQFCQENNPDSGTICLALADVLGTIAALLDQKSGKYEFPDRMQTFCNRVEETYERLRDQVNA